MNKRILSLVLALCMLAALLTACGGSTGRRDKHAAINQDADAIATEPPGDSKATITVATWDGGLGSQWLEQAAKAFEEKYADATHFEDGKVGVDVIIKASRSYDGSAIHLTPLKEDIYFLLKTFFLHFSSSKQSATWVYLFTYFICNIRNYRI